MEIQYFVEVITSLVVIIRIMAFAIVKVIIIVILAIIVITLDYFTLAFIHHPCPLVVATR